MAEAMTHRKTARPDWDARIQAAIQARADALGVAQIPKAALAESLGLSPKQLGRYVSGLRERGTLAVIPGSGPGRPACYVILAGRSLPELEVILTTRLGLQGQELEALLASHPGAQVACAPRAGVSGDDPGSVGPDMAPIHIGHAVLTDVTAQTGHVHHVHYQAPDDLPPHVHLSSALVVSSDDHHPQAAGQASHVHHVHLSSAAMSTTDVHLSSPRPAHSAQAASPRTRLAEASGSQGGGERGGSATQDLKHQQVNSLPPSPSRSSNRSPQEPRRAGPRTEVGETAAYLATLGVLSADEFDVLPLALVQSTVATLQRTTSAGPGLIVQHLRRLKAAPPASPTRNLRGDYQTRYTTALTRGSEFLVQELPAATDQDLSAYADYVGCGVEEHVALGRIRQSVEARVLRAARVLAAGRTRAVFEAIATALFDGLSTDQALAAAELVEAEEAA